MAPAYDTTPRLKDRVAVVTGAGQGIGAGIAEAFCRAGASVVIAERNPVTGAAKAAALSDAGYPAHFVETDVADPASIAAMAAETDSTFGPMDILVNNAGINVAHEPMDLTKEEWDRCMSVDLEGVWQCCRAALERMLPRERGAIVNIASVHSFRIIPDFMPYNVAKHGVVGITRALGIQYAARGIRVNAIAPGYILTEIVEEWWARFDDPLAERRRAEALHPCKRIGTPEEIAMTAVFLASDEARFLNAETIRVDGGRSLLFHD